MFNLKVKLPLCCLYIVEAPFILRKYWTIQARSILQIHTNTINRKNSSERTSTIEPPTPEPPSVDRNVTSPLPPKSWRLRRELLLRFDEPDSSQSSLSSISSRQLGFNRWALGSTWQEVEPPNSHMAHCVLQRTCIVQVELIKTQVVI